MVDTVGNTVGALGEGLTGTVQGVGDGVGSTVQFAGGALGAGAGKVGGMFSGSKGSEGEAVLVKVAAARNANHHIPQMPSKLTRTDCKRRRTTRKRSHRT